MAPHAGEQENYVRSFTMVEQTALRRRTEAAVEALLDLLDELDGDPDTEDDGTVEDDIDHAAEWGCA